MSSFSVTQTEVSSRHCGDELEAECGSRRCRNAKKMPAILRCRYPSPLSPRSPSPGSAVVAKRAANEGTGWL